MLFHNRKSHGSSINYVTSFPDFLTPPSSKSTTFLLACVINFWPLPPPPKKKDKDVVYGRPKKPSQATSHTLKLSFFQYLLIDHFVLATRADTTGWNVFCRSIFIFVKYKCVFIALIRNILWKHTDTVKSRVLTSLL